MQKKQAEHSAWPHRRVQDCSATMSPQHTYCRNRWGGRVISWYVRAIFPSPHPRHLILQSLMCPLVMHFHSPHSYQGSIKRYLSLCIHLPVAQQQGPECAGGRARLTRNCYTASSRANPVGSLQLSLEVPSTIPVFRHAVRAKSDVNGHTSHSMPRGIQMRDLKRKQTRYSVANTHRFKFVDSTGERCSS
jgi:hypothetical protein